MNSTIEEQLITAQEAKNSDIFSFVWKGARDANHEQKEFKLVDASEEQLKKCLKHCEAMLYNPDKNNPGRYTLLKIIDDQCKRCNAELFLRWLENVYDYDESRSPIKRSTFLLSLNAFLSNNDNAIPKDHSQMFLTEVTNGLPTEFSNLTVDYVIDACLGRLGTFNKKHMTLKFIVNKLGLWFTAQEMKEFSEEAKRVGKSRIEIVKDRCFLRPSVNIVVKDTKVLNFKEFRALVQLRNKAYNEMTTDQLLVLRDKGLFGLCEEVRHHIDQWKSIINKIEKVAEYKGYNLHD